MIQLRTLGTCGLTDEADTDFAAVLRQPKRFALLTYLALARPRGFLRRDAIMALFWPELDDEHARASLRQSLYTIRRQLPGDVVVNRGDAEVGVNRDRLWCDVPAFEAAVAEERYDEALELYRGDLLTGFHLPDASPDLGYWIDAERDRLRNIAVDAAAAAATEAEDRGDLDEAVRFAGRASAIAPLDEERARTHVELLHRSGDRSGALLALERWAERFESELELPPSDATRELAERLRREPPPRTRPSRSSPSDASAPEPAEEEAATTVPEMPDPNGSRGAGGGRFLRRVLVGAAAVVVIAVAVVLSPIRVGWMDGTAATAGNRVMILPFSYRGAVDGDYLSEGLVYLFSVALDGGEFRAVDPHAIIRQATNDGSGREFDPAGASELADRLEADYFVLGNAVTAGDRLRLTVRLYPADGGAPLASASATGATDSVIDLVDAATVELLTQRSGPPSRVTRLAAVTTASLPALKSYLTGERLMREGRFSDALSSFEAAVREDSLFALAHYRASSAASWAFRGGVANRAAARAVQHADRLPEHERRLLAAHQAYRQGRAAEAEEILHELAASHPDDAEVWYRLGEVMLHLGPLAGGEAADAREPFQRATRTEPAHPEAYYHLAQISALEGDTAAAEEFARLALNAAPDGARTPQLRTLLAALGRGGGWNSRVRDLAGADEFTLVSATYNVAVYAGRPDLARDVARRLVEPSRSADTRLFGYLLLAELELALGRWSAAEAHLAEMGELDPALADRHRALLALAPAARMAVPEMERLLDRLRGAAPGEVRPALSPWRPDDEFGELPTLYARGLLAARLGRTAEVMDVIATMTTDTSDPGLAAELTRDLRLAGGFEVSAAPPSFDHPVETMVLSPVLSRPGRRYEHAVWLAEEGREQDARRVLESLMAFSVNDLPWGVPALLDRARLHEELGEPAEAAALYARFVRLWDEADHENRVQLAATRLSRIERENGSR